MEIMIALAAGRKKNDAPSISKTTVNYASKRGLELTVEEDGDDYQLWIWNAEEESEPMCMYNFTPEGWQYKGNVYLPNRVKEELPNWIKDEKHLRQVVDFLKDQV